MVLCVFVGLIRFFYGVPHVAQQPFSRLSFRSEYAQPNLLLIFRFV